MDGNQAATKQDLKDLEDRLHEFVRDAQTEILRGIERFASANNIRMRKLEADMSNLNVAEGARMTLLEERVFEIEKRVLGRQFPPAPSPQA